MTFIRSYIEEWRSDRQNVIYLAGMNNPLITLAHHDDMKVGGRKHSRQFSLWLIRQCADISELLRGSGLFYFSELAAAAYETKYDVVTPTQFRCRIEDCVQRMTRAVVSGVHHYKLFGKIVTPAERFPALFVKMSRIVVRPRRNDFDFALGNTLVDNSLLRESIERDDLLCVPHTALQKRCKYFRD